MVRGFPFDVGDVVALATCLIPIEITALGHDGFLGIKEGDEHYFAYRCPGVAPWFFFYRMKCEARS